MYIMAQRVRERETIVTLKETIKSLLTFPGIQPHQAPDTNHNLHSPLPSPTKYEGCKGETPPKRGPTLSRNWPPRILMILMRGEDKEIGEGWK